MGRIKLLDEQKNFIQKFVKFFYQCLVCEISNVLLVAICGPPLEVVGSPDGPGDLCLVSLCDESECDFLKALYSFKLLFLFFKT